MRHDRVYIFCRDIDERSCACRPLEGKRSYLLAPSAHAVVCCICKTDGYKRKIISGSIFNLYNLYKLTLYIELGADIPVHFETYRAERTAGHSGGARKLIRCACEQASGTETQTQRQTHTQHTTSTHTHVHVYACTYIYMYTKIL